MKKFLRVFTGHMRTDRAQSDLQEAIKLATSHTACLLCFERNHEHCHRTIGASAIAKVTNQSVRPIGIPKGIAASCNYPIVTPMHEHADTFA